MLIHPPNHLPACLTFGSCSPHALLAARLQFMFVIHLLVSTEVVMCHVYQLYCRMLIAGYMASALTVLGGCSQPLRYILGDISCSRMKGICASIRKHNYWLYHTPSQLPSGVLSLLVFRSPRRRSVASRVGGAGPWCMGWSKHQGRFVRSPIHSSTWFLFAG